MINTAQNGKAFTWSQKRTSNFDNSPVCRSKTDTRCVTLGVPPTADVTNPAWHVDQVYMDRAAQYVDGYLWFGRLGGWDPEVLVGQRVRILGGDGPVAGVIGKKSRHHQDEADREKPSKLRDLWIDVGAADAKAPDSDAERPE